MNIQLGAWLKRYRLPCGIALLYLVLVLLITWPLIAHLSTSVLGEEGDNFIYIWNHWHVKQALINFNSPYSTNSIAFPFTTSLVFHTLTFSLASISTLLQIFLPVVVSFNLILIASLVATAFGTYLLLHDLYRQRWTAIIGGFFMLCNVYTFSTLLGHFNYSSTFVIPFYFFFLLRAWRRNSLGYAAAAGLMAVISFYNEFIYTVGLCFCTLIFLGYVFYRQREELMKKHRVFWIVGGLSLVLCTPLVWSALRVMIENPPHIPQLHDVIYYAPDIRSFFLPHSSNILFSSWTGDFYHRLGSHGNSLYLTYSLLILAILGYRWHRDTELYSRNLWLGLLVVFFFLTLGPVIFLNKPLLTLPYQLLYHLPLLNNILVTPHFVIFVIFFLILLAAPACRKFSQPAASLYQKGLLVLLIGIYFFEVQPGPLPLTRTSIPNFYYEIAKDSEEYTILELPFALSTSFYTLGNGTTPAKTEYYQTVHGKKLLSAWISRLPDDYYVFYNSVVGLSYLIQPVQQLSPDEINALREATRANFNKLGIRYIIVHPEYYNHIQLRNTISFLNDVYQTKPQLKDNMLVYDLRSPTKNTP